MLAMSAKRIKAQRVEGLYTVCIREESNASHNHKPQVVPTKRCLVDFGQRQTPPLVRVANVRIYGGDILICAVSDLSKAGPGHLDGG